MVNYVGFVPADEEMKESWSPPGDPGRVEARTVVESRNLSLTEASGGQLS